MLNFEKKNIKCNKSKKKNQKLTPTGLLLTKYRKRSSKPLMFDMPHEENIFPKKLSQSPNT